MKPDGSNPAGLSLCAPALIVSGWGRFRFGAACFVSSTPASTCREKALPSGAVRRLGAAEGPLWRAWFPSPGAHGRSRADMSTYEREASQVRNQGRNRTSFEHSEVARNRVETDLPEAPGIGPESGMFSGLGIRAEMGWKSGMESTLFLTLKKSFQNVPN